MIDYITYQELNEMYLDRFTNAIKTAEYIRYLQRVDSKLWTPTMIENELELNQSVVSNCLRKRKPKLKLDRRKVPDRRKK